MPRRLSHIRFRYQRPVSFTGKAQLKEVVALMGKNYGKAIFDLTYVFCTDEFLLDINERFLNHHDLTDIITFNLSEDPSMVQGEIYISADRVRENADLFRVPVYEEVARVVFHGALHLCGLKDKSRKDIAQMRDAEEMYLRKFKTRLFHVKQKRKKSFT